MTAFRFLEPIDVLVLRGNKLFGDAGSFGESLVPPWPSVAAGAVRSQMLATEGVDLARFASGGIEHPQLGTPAEPGKFRLTAFLLARRTGSAIETLHPLPADLVATREAGRLRLHRLLPAKSPPGIESSAPLGSMPALASDTRAKAETGLWLTQAGWGQYLDGEIPDDSALVESSAMWTLDPRVGIGLDARARSAEEGKLFTAQAVAFQRDHGFLVGIDGADPPSTGALRLGGDGRGAAVHAVEYRAPEVDYEAICATGRCRLVLSSPGIFPGGWRLPGLDEHDRFALDGARGRLVSAAVPRGAIISGWDLANRQPKPAQRAASAGSVYWLDELDTTADALRKLVEDGLWNKPCENPSRRAEGFNRCVIGAW